MGDRMRALRKQVDAVVRRDAVESERAEEFAFHLQMETEKNLAQGMSPAEARRAALVEFGGLERYAERVRESRRARMLEDLWQDLRYAVRSMLRRPAFAAAVVATLGLGIGGTTAVFSVADALYLRGPVGVAAPFEVMRLWIVRDEGGIQTPSGGPGSYVDYVAIRDAAHGLSGVAPHLMRAADMGRGEAAERIRASAVGHGFFELLGVTTARGRLFHEVEGDVIDAYPVVVLSHHFAERLGDAGDVGGTVDLNGRAFTVIGVLQPDFTGLDAQPVDVWVPMAAAGAAGLASSEPGQDWRQVPEMATVHLVGRLAPGANREQVAASATAALRRVAAEAPQLDPTPEVLLGGVIPGREMHRGQSATLALWLLVVAGIVLAIACANVLNLLLARTTARGRENAVRLSLGAGRGRLVRQHLTETLLLTLLGGAAGLLAAYWGAGIARQFPLPPAAGGIDGRIILFGMATSLLIGFAVGVLPALRASRSNAAAGLREAKGTLTVSRGRLRRTLLFAQVVLSVVLLVGAGLLVRSLQAVHAIDAGVDIDRVMIASADWGRAGYTGDERELLLAEAVRRLEDLPGVERAALAHFGPFAGAAMSGSVHAPDALPGATPVAHPELDWAGTRYFDATGTRILAGRAFHPEDRDGPEPVAVVNEAAAHLLVPGASIGEVVGACVAVNTQLERGTCTRILGVAETQRRRFLDADAPPVIYLSRDRSPHVLTWGGPVLVVRTASAAPAAAAQVRAALQSLRPDLPYISVQTLEERTSGELLPYRLGATLFSLFGALALILAAVGLYGVLGYYVTERTAEIGIRRSLGARDAAILRLLARQALLPAGAGLVTGLLIAAAGARLLEALIFGIPARDPVAFGAAAAFLLLVALAATVLPARRATNVDPAMALRAE
jgi:predicted permease